MNIGRNTKKQNSFIPEIDLNKCESDGICVKSCLFKVFEMNLISDRQFSKLSLIGKIKTLFHGRNKAIVIYPYQCTGCGVCIIACPEKAIKLIKS